MNTYIFKVRMNKGFKVGLGLAVLITGWNVPGLHNLSDDGKMLKVKTHLDLSDVMRIVSKRTRNGVELTLLKKE